MGFNKSESKKEINSLNSWLKLSLTPGIGPKIALQIFEYYPNLADFFKDFGEFKLKKESIDWLKNPDEKLIEKQINWVNQSENNHLINIEDNLYPKSLKQLANPPILLYIKGDLNLLNLPQISIVGSRNPSSQGIKITRHIAKILSNSGWLITSGLASGIDSAAHLGAIDAKNSTIAVMGTGINKIYPTKNLNLASQILEIGGCLLSEFPLDAPPNGYHFPQRNRIIASLSLATIVTESSQKSGSLITAKLANDFGREVFALPGSIIDPLSEGSNQLISEGAHIITSIDGLIAELDLIFSHIKPIKTLSVLTNEQLLNSKTNNEVNKIKHPLLKFIEYQPKSIDEIVFESKIPISEVQGELSLLEISGLIQYLPDGQIVKKHEF